MSIMIIMKMVIFRINNNVIFIMIMTMLNMISVMLIIMITPLIILK